tara:strand:+ start:59 stop:721 length:663 start_codon:yes stop_codon:yes gene_type:complete
LRISQVYNFFYYLFYKPKIFFPKKSYSLLGEDLIIKNFFKNQKKGLYVDVGAYHPLEGSNTHLLFKKGWHGINIDVNPLSIELFKILRPYDKNLNFAISDKKGFKKLYFRKKINMLNTLDKQEAEINFPNGYQIKKVRADTLNNILKRLKLNKKIDFLNIDVEGFEMKVLKSIKLNNYKPKLICVEIHDRNANYNIKNYLRKKNYNFYWKNHFSYIFKRK